MPVRPGPSRARVALLALGLGRAAAGTTMLVRPGLLPRAVGGAGAPAWLVQMLGAREVAVGLGGARCAGPAWLAAGLLCDAVDAVAVAGAIGRGRVRSGPGAAVVAVAVAAVAVQAAELARART